MTRRNRYKRRRSIIVLAVSVIAGIIILSVPDMWTQQAAEPTPSANSNSETKTVRALDALETLAVKGRAPKTGYARDQFGAGWGSAAGCDTRNTILYRDLVDSTLGAGCKVARGTLQDPYTGTTITFMRGQDTSSDVQIDHVVALSDAWQKGAQQLSYERRVAFANDPLNLLAVDGEANQEKSDGDAATWLPANKPFRCQYVARQIAVKQSYDLWVTAAEKNAMIRVLQNCPNQPLP